MKILITGGNGQLGKALISSFKKVIKDRKVKLLITTRNELDLNNINSCREYINQKKPDWIINTAAYTEVDKAEIEQEKAWKTNAEAPKILAESIKLSGGKFLQISTDFVFSGKQNYPYLPYQEMEPLNVYGMTKSEGEKLVRKALGNNAYTLRTSWLYNRDGNNFLNTILNLIRKRSNDSKKICVVSDQIGCPTNTLDLSIACWKIINTPIEKVPNIMHWSDAGVASWYDFAVEIGKLAFKAGFVNKVPRIVPIRSSEYKSKALRPNYSLLDYEELSEVISFRPNHWSESLNKVISKTNNYN